MAAPISTALPTAPLLSDSPSQFEEKAFSFVGALEPFRVDLQAQADFVNTNIGPGSDVETVANIAAAVATVAAVAVDITQLVANDWTKPFLTLAAATADPNIEVDDGISLKERTTGNGGGGMWDVISGTGTANGIDLVAHDTLSLTFVLRTDGTVYADQLGFLEGDVDNSATLVTAVGVLPVINCGTKTFKIKTQAAITLTRTTIFTASSGGGFLTDVANGALGDNISINCAGFSFGTIGLNVSGGGVSGMPFYVFANQESTGKVIIKDGSFNDSYVGSGTGGNHGLFIRGGFEEVKVFGTEFKNHTRLVGVGNPGVSGTSGLSITHLNTFDVKNVLVEGCTFDTITNGEITDNANNTDADGLKIFANVAGNSVRRTSATIANCHFKNCKGRAIKTQNDVTTVIAPNIYRNISGITGASIEIDLQIHGGDVISPTFTYEDSTSGEATLIRPPAPISFFAAGTLIKPRICNVSDVTIHDNTTGGGSLSALITASQSDLTTAFDSVVNVTNVISTAKHESFMGCPALTGTGKFFANINNVYVKEINTSNGLFGFASSASLKEAAIINISRFTNAGADTKPTYQTTTPASLAKPTLKMTPSTGVSEVVDDGVSSLDNRLTGIDENGINTQDTGLRVFSQSLADDATMTIDIPTSNGRGIATITTTDSRFSFGIVSIDSSGALNFGAGAGSNFNPGGTANNDVDTDLNVWATGGQLLIKNRLGSARTITVVFQG